jgi:hypothetical protein
MLTPPPERCIMSGWRLASELPYPGAAPQLARRRVRTLILISKKPSVHGFPAAADPKDRRRLT